MDEIKFIQSKHVRLFKNITILPLHYTLFDDFGIKFWLHFNSPFLTVFNVS